MEDIVALTFNPTLWGTLSLAEALWLLITTFGACYSIWNLADALGDRRYLMATQQVNKDDKLIANANVRNEFLFSSIQITMLATGVLAAFIPSNPKAESLGLLLFTLFLICGSILLAYGSYKNRQDRRILKGERQ